METTTLQKLRQYLQSTTKEQFEKDWAEVEELHLEGPTVAAYLADLARSKSCPMPVAKILSENVDVVFAKDESNTLFLAA